MKLRSFFVQKLSFCIYFVTTDVANTKKVLECLHEEYLILCEAKNHSNVNFWSQNDFDVSKISAKTKSKNTESQKCSTYHEKDLFVSFFRYLHLSCKFPVIY